MDAYSFKPGDPDIVLTRRTAVQILNHLEMWFDVVEARTDKKDVQLVQLKQQLTKLLEDDHPPRILPDGAGVPYGYSARVEQYRDLDPQLLEQAVNPGAMLVDLCRFMINEVDLLASLHERVGSRQLRIKVTQPIKYVEPEPEPEPTPEEQADEHADDQS